MKSLSKYLEKRKKAILGLLRKHEEKFDAAALHTLRIEIKKMNALFWLLHSSVKDFNRARAYKPFKRVFNQAGIVRELCLEEAMLKKYPLRSLSKGFRRGLKKRRLKEQKKLLRVLDDELTVRLKYTFSKLEPVVSKKVVKRKVKEYLQSRRLKIEKLVRKENLSPSKMHKLRKRLKEYEYNRDSVGRTNPKSRSIKVNPLPDLLGKWHDCQVMIRHLENATQAVGDHPAEVVKLTKIATRVSRDRDAMVKQIDRALKASEFYHSEKSTKR